MAEDKFRKTPMFEALNAPRYHRQELFRHIKSLSGIPLISYVSGPEGRIDRADTAYFNDLVYSFPPNQSIDLLLHTPGGDVDAAEKLMSMLRLRIGIGRLRVIVPDFAKSAGTLIAIGADEIVMSETSELGPIDPQVTYYDDHNNPTTYSVQAYLDAFDQLSEALRRNPDDVPTQKLFDKLDPARIFYFQAVKNRARLFAETQLKRGMCREHGNVTKSAGHLIDTKQWPSHGQVIAADAAQGLGLTINRREPGDQWWDACWRLYCLERLAVSDRGKLFESETVFMVSSFQRDST